MKRIYSIFQNFLYESSWAVLLFFRVMAIGIGTAIVFSSALKWETGGLLLMWAGMILTAVSVGAQVAQQFHASPERQAALEKTLRLSARWFRLAIPCLLMLFLGSALGAVEPFQVLGAVWLCATLGLWGWLSLSTILPKQMQQLSTALFNRSPHSGKPPC